ncbi:MAG: MBL fold metallo-hydrolase, partial [Ferruginibacter sp.]
GVAGLAEKYFLPVFITSHTSQNCSVPIKKELAHTLTAHEPVNIGGLSITAFPKCHDAVDPHSFIITCNDITIGVFTDIGIPCAHVIKYFSQCHAAFLEANYDEVLLEKGRYPRFLKNRISGGMGHLSNRQALEIFTTYRSPFMTHLLLAHLSQDNNDPVMVQRLFNDHAEGIEVVVASRHEQTAIYTIQKPAQGRQFSKPLPIRSLRPMQLSLF